jgi:hypothetical protein
MDQEQDTQANQRADTAPLSLHHWCVQCGAQADAAWEFCGACGHRMENRTGPVPFPTQLEPQEPTAMVILAESAPSASTGALVTLTSEEPIAPSRPRVRGVLFGMLLIVLVAGAAIASYLYKVTSDDLDSTRAELASTQESLETTKANLATSQRSLDDTKAGLVATTGDLQDSEQKLRAARQQLKGLHGSLENAQDRLDLQANQIETLKTCLNGVSSALSYVAYSDYSAAIAALNAVEVSCNRAYDML